MSRSIFTSVIVAGGKGERLEPITKYQPKALVPFCGVPFIKLIIDQMFRLDMKKVIVLTGHFGEHITDYLTDVFSDKIDKIEIIPFPTDISKEERLASWVETCQDPFLLNYCDNYIIDDDFVAAQIRTQSRCRLILQKRKEGNFELISAETCREVSKERSSNSSYVELGYVAVNNVDGNDLINELRNSKSVWSTFESNAQLDCTVYAGPFLSISNRETYVSQKSFGRLIVLDRDGVINKKPNHRTYISDFAQFSYLQTTLEILMLLSKQGYSFVIATNQPGVALGTVDDGFLTKLHIKITNDLRKLGISVLAFYVCKHHWDEKCNCRKPRPGMLLEICKDFNMEAANTVYVGDEEKDCQAAKSVGMPFVDIKSIAKLSGYSSE